MLPPSGEWRVTTEFLNFPGFGVDPEHPEQMTEGVKPIYPVLPTLLTRDVESVMPSKFFSSIKVFTASEKTPNQSKNQTEKSDSESEEAADDEYADEPPAPSGIGPGVGPKVAQRIISELKDKAPAFAPADPALARLQAELGGPQPTAASDAVSALVNLGYGQVQAGAAVTAAMKKASEKASAEQLIRLALRELAVS